jgi:hypothetical protein
MAERLFELPKVKDPRQDRRPTHLHDEGAPRTRCGIRMTSDKRFPYVRAEHAQAHVDGWGMTVCGRCLEAS